MQSIQRYSSLGIAFLVSFGMIDVASAQAIIITNANNHEIPLRSGSSVQIDAQGNLLAECALTSGICTQLSGAGGAPIGAPTATLSRTDNDTEVQTGEFISLAWSSNNASVCAATSTGPTTPWPGPRLTTGNQTINFNTAGAYVFSLTCYNDMGGSSLQTVPVTVTEAPAAPSGCDITSNSPWFQPPSLTRVNQSFEDAFDAPDGDPKPLYPQGLGFPVPIGANKGSYLSVPFVARANTQVRLTWDTVQANGPQGYSAPRPADAMFIGISPCPGDLRPTNDNSADRFLHQGCRRVNGLDSMYYSSTTATVDPSTICQLEAGKTYYMNFAPVNPIENPGGPNGSYTCSTTAANSTNGCDVQIRHSASTIL